MQKAKPGRGQRVAEQIARDLAEIIPLEVRDPRVGLVTITGCEITPDYAHARVFFTVTSFFNYYFVYMIDENYISKCSEAVGP